MSERRLRTLLAMCTIRLDTDLGPRGTAFFVAPHYAVTAAHVVDGLPGLPVWLRGRGDSWQGHVEDARPAASAAAAAASELYPAPDVALIHVNDGPAHATALLAGEFSYDGELVMTRGHTKTFDGDTVTAETASFRLDGDLETPDPGCTLLKLGLGQAPQGMSGAPVLNPRTGEVIGLLRTSRGISTNLGAWVVPAELIRRLWPDQLGDANGHLGQDHQLWQQAAAESGQYQDRADTQPDPGRVVIEGDVGVNMSGGNAGIVNVTMGKPARHRRYDGPGTR
jgi:hypothetical protein